MLARPTTRVNWRTALVACKRTTQSQHRKTTTGTLCIGAVCASSSVLNHSSTRVTLSWCKRPRLSRLRWRTIGALEPQKLLLKFSCTCVGVPDLCCTFPLRAGEFRLSGTAKTVKALPAKSTTQCELIILLWELVVLALCGLPQILTKATRLKW